MSIAETTSDPTTAESEESTTDESQAVESTSDDGIARDDLFHVLQCRRRRLVLKYLQEYPGDGPADMSDIAEHIAALEHDTTVDSLRSKERQRVYIALYQSHLPKMDDAGVINYNQDRGLVEATALATSFEKYLDEEPSLLSTTTELTPSTDAVTAHDRTEARTSTDAQWSSRYLGTACATLVAVGGLALSGTAVSGVAVALVVSLLFVTLALSHRLSLSSPQSLVDRLQTALSQES